MSAGSASPEALMAHAVEYGIAHVESGGLPFVGLLVADDGWVSDPGVNLVRETGDPTAHAEVVALRVAARARSLPALTGATLLATGEPCARCYRVAATYGVGTVHFAVDRDTAAAYGFDYRAGYDDADRLPLAASAQHTVVAGGLDPFIRYREHHRADSRLRTRP